MIATEWYDHRDIATENVTVPAGLTAVTAIFGPVPEGQVWYIEKLYYKTSTHTATFAAYVSSGQAADPLAAGRVSEQVAASATGLFDYVNPIFVPPGYNLILVFTGGTLVATDQVQINLQRAWCLTNPGSQYGSLSGASRMAITEMDEVEAMRRNTSHVVPGSGDWNLLTPVDDLEGAGLAPWAAMDPADAADNPAHAQTIPDGGVYVGDNELGPTHPLAPFQRPNIGNSGKP